MKHLHRLVEHDGQMIYNKSTLSRPSDNLPCSTKILIYEEENNLLPHFHVLINDKVDIKVNIKHIHELNIIDNSASWNDFVNVKEAVFNWLFTKHKKAKDITNAQYLVYSWNDNNPSNEIDDDFYL